MRVVVGSILVLCALLATARAEGAHVRAAILVATAEDRALTERVRGQTSDLDAELSVQDARSIAPTFEARMREADAVVRRSAASAVIWFRVAGGTVVVYAAVPAQDRVLVRSLGGGAGKPSSATLEAAALVVRDVLRALGQGATVGELREKRDGSDDAAPPVPLYICADAACAEPIRPLVLRSPSPPPAPPPLRAPTFTSYAGWQAVRARDAPSIMNALDLRMGARYGGLFAVLVLTLGAVDVERVTERADLLVRRHALGLGAGATWALGQDVSLGVGLMAGGVTFVRATRSLSPAFVPSETRHHVHLFAGPEARVSWSVASSLALVVALGLDFVVNAPRFEVVAVPGRSSVYGLADVQPRLGLGLEWSSFKSH